MAISSTSRRLDTATFIKLLTACHVSRKRYNLCIDDNSSSTLFSKIK